MRRIRVANTLNISRTYTVDKDNTIICTWGVDTTPLYFEWLQAQIQSLCFESSNEINLINSSNTFSFSNPVIANSEHGLRILISGYTQFNDNIIRQLEQKQFVRV